MLQRHFYTAGLAVYITLGRMKPHVLNLIAACAMAAPLGVWIAAEIAVRVIPGCKAQNFGDTVCFVGTINLAGALMLARIGGFAIFLVLTLLVALPLFVIAAFLILHNRSAQKRRPTAAPDLQR